MRSFLYLSPYFPPDSRVGALRPLKFARHLPAHGYRPIVLADAPASGRDERLTATLPADVRVIRDFAWGTRQRLARVPNGHPRAARGVASAALRRITRPLTSFFEQPELVPLGPHALHIPHALRAARRVIAENGCRAIVVNADPFAAAVVGALLAEQTGLPLLVDFRDPWALCTLRRPLRQGWVSSSVDALERFVVERASRVILNTETTRLDYAAHYANVPSERFVCIPNHADPSLHSRVEPNSGAFQRFTLLVAGTLRRFVEGDVLLELLATLLRRGVDERRLGLVITGGVPDGFLSRAAALGVMPMLELTPSVSYLDVPSLLAQADLLVLLSHQGRQRIPAKLYDYALSKRPLLVITENPELRELSARVGGAHVFEPAHVEPMADLVANLLERGRRQEIERHFAWDSATATEHLARLLGQAIG